MFREDHQQAPCVRALLQAAHLAKQREAFPGFGRSRIGMDVTVRPERPIGPASGDVTNALGGIGDTLQANRVGVDLAYLGELSDAVLYYDDSQIREVRYREEPGEAGYTVRFWVLPEETTPRREGLIAERLPR